jgi:hypothetical protein
MKLVNYFIDGRCEKFRILYIAEGLCKSVFQLLFQKLTSRLLPEHKQKKKKLLSFLASFNGYTFLSS